VASGLQNTNVRANLYETGQNRTMNCDIMAGCHSARQEVTTWVKKTKMMSHHNKMNLYIYIREVIFILGLCLYIFNFGSDPI